MTCTTTAAGSDTDRQAILRRDDGWRIAAHHNSPAS
jgi:hypothetical protein